MNREIQKILMVGNAAGGKTRLARRLSQLHGLPLTHVDSIQFLPGMKIRPLDETRKILSQITTQPKWIIDGHGPLDQIEKRFVVADRIVFIDLPITRHYWWLAKRQFQSLWRKRTELPEGCNEISYKHTVKIVKSMWKMHQQMRPELNRIFARDHLKNKVVIIRSTRDWNQVFSNGIQ